VPPCVWPADPLGLGEAPHQRPGVGLVQGVPDVAEGLALHAGDVREGLAHRDRVRYVGQVVAQVVVEGEPPLVAQLHHHHGGEGLGVGGDEVLVVGAGRPAAPHLARADPGEPQQVASAAHRRGQAGDPALALLRQGGAVQEPLGVVRERAHGRDRTPPVAQPRASSASSIFVRERWRCSRWRSVCTRSRNVLSSSSRQRV
jgi:hypothetical protein